MSHIHISSIQRRGPVLPDAVKLAKYAFSNNTQTDEKKAAEEAANATLLTKFYRYVLKHLCQNSVDKLVLRMNETMAVTAVAGIAFWICEFLAIVGASKFTDESCVQMVNNERVEQLYIFTDLSKFFQAIYTMITFVHLLEVFFYYKVQVKLEASSMRLTQIEDASIWASGFRNYYFLESIVTLIQPIPGLAANPPSYLEGTDIANQQVKVGIFMFFRLFVFARVYRDRSYMYRNRREVIAATRNSSGKSVRFDWFYSFKAVFFKTPGKVTCVLLLSSIAVAAVSFYVAEWSSFEQIKCSNKNEFLSSFTFADSLYLTFITMATVGYGDVSPKTNMGRTVAVIAAILGVLLGSLFISAVCQRLALSLHELWSISYAWSKEYEREERDAAALLIQLWYSRLTKCRTHDHSHFRRNRWIPNRIYDLFQLDRMALYQETLARMREVRTKRKRFYAEFIACGDQINNRGLRSGKVLQRIKSLEPRIAALEAKNEEILQSLQTLTRLTSKTAMGRASSVATRRYNASHDFDEQSSKGREGGGEFSGEESFDELDDTESLDWEYEPGFC